VDRSEKEVGLRKTGFDHANARIVAYNILESIASVTAKAPHWSRSMLHPALLCAPGS
jgi:hypothetical protein